MSYIVKGYPMPTCCNNCPMVEWNEWDAAFYCSLTGEETLYRPDYDGYLIGDENSSIPRLSSCPLEPID